jgi:hypothetical protein
MKESEFNPEVKSTAQEQIRLREDIPFIKGEIVDTAKGNPELEILQEKMDEDGETHWVDFEGGDLEAMKAEGFKDAGIGSYLISPIGERNWFSDRYMSCTGVVAIGRDVLTGKEISFLSHQDPNYFVDGDKDKREMFSRALGDSLRALEARSEKDSVEVLLVGGNFNPKTASGGDYKHDQYKRSIQALDQIVQGLTGFDPRVLAGPNNHVGSETVVVVETQKRKIWIDRSEQPPEFDQPYPANNIDEAEKRWLSSETHTIGTDSR